MRPEGVEEEHDVDQRKGLQKKRKQHLPNLGHLPSSILQISGTIFVLLFIDPQR